MSKHCLYCGKNCIGDYCFQHKPAKPLKANKRISRYSPKTKEKEDAAKAEWFAANPPDDNGNWVCYLQISPFCPVLLTIETVVQEHVISKTHAPELKYDITNRKPSCDPCNELKAGRWLEDIPEYNGPIPVYKPLTK